MGLLNEKLYSPNTCVFIFGNAIVGSNVEASQCGVV